MNETMADRLRVACGLLAAHPELPTPCVWGYSTGMVEVQWQILRDDTATQRDTMNAIRRAVGGEWKKDADFGDFTLRTNRDGVDLTIMAKREAVCTPRVVGTETVTIPAVQAAVIEAAPERTETRDIIEWDCGPVIVEKASA